MEELNASLRSCERVKIDWKETKGGCSSELYFNLYRNLETAVLGEKVSKQSLSTTYMMDQGR